MSVERIAPPLIVVALTVYGFHYYMLPLAERVKSPQHAILKPGGIIGRSIGMLGLAMFAVMYVYPFRKRWSRLAGWGTSRRWLDYHIVLGLTAPVLITFHASFKLNGLAGVAYWIMILVALSGFVGRYFYSMIPHRIDEAEMSMEELQQKSAELTIQLEGQGLIKVEDLKPLFDLPTREQVQAMSIWRALETIFVLDVKRAINIARLRWRTTLKPGDHAEFNRVLAATKHQAQLAKSMVFLSKMKQLFELWHVVHRPCSLSFALLAILHITVVTLFGFF